MRWRSRQQAAEAKVCLFRGSSLKLAKSRSAVFEPGNVVLDGRAGNSKTSALA